MNQETSLYSIHHDLQEIFFVISEIFDFTFSVVCEIDLESYELFLYNLKKGFFMKIEKIKKLLKNSNISSFSAKQENPKIKEVDLTSDPLTLFNKTLTEEEQKSPAGMLSRDKIYGYIKAIYELYDSTIDDKHALIGKMQVLLALSLQEKEISSLNMNFTFKGSKFEVKEEVFNIAIVTKEKAEIIPNIYKLTECEGQAPKEKIARLISDEVSVLEVYDFVNSQLKDDGDLSTKTASQILLMLDICSLLNVENYVTEIVNPSMDGKKLQEKIYSIDILRQEINFPLVKSMGHRSI